MHDSCVCADITATTERAPPNEAFTGVHRVTGASSSIVSLVGARTSPIASEPHVFRFDGVEAEGDRPGVGEGHAFEFVAGAPGVGVENL